MRRRFVIALTALFLILLFHADQLSSRGQAVAPQSSKHDLPAELQMSLKSGLLGDSMSDAEYEEGAFRVDQFDLNRDGRSENFVLGYCSPTGNCDLWIIEKTRKGYRVLLATHLAQVVCVRSTRTKGSLDVETKSHGSAFDSTVTVFRFDGKGYQPAESYDLRWKYDEQTGQTRQVEGPTRKPKCHGLFARPK